MNVQVDQSESENGSSNKSYGGFESLFKGLSFLQRLKVTGMLGTEEDHDLTHLLTTTITSSPCEEKNIVEQVGGPGTV